MTASWVLEPAFDSGPNCFDHIPCGAKAEQEMFGGQKSAKAHKGLVLFGNFVSGVP
jgi:hypothetical protein